MINVLVYQSDAFFVSSFTLYLLNVGFVYFDFCWLLNWSWCLNLVIWLLM